MSDFTRIMHKKNIILNSNPLHFITFSLLFLPQTIFITTLALFSFSTSAADISFKTLFTLVIIALPIPPTVTAATALITYATHQIIHHTKPTFTSTVKSLSHSFVPLHNTLFAETLLLVPFLLGIPLSFSQFLESFAFSKALAFCFLVYSLTVLKGGVGVAAPISVFESIYGFAALRTSQNQLVGLRKCASYIFLNAMLLIGVLLWDTVRLKDSKCVSKWVFAVEFCIVNVISCLMLLEYVVANSVLYSVARGDEAAVESVVGYKNEGFRLCTAIASLIRSFAAPWLIPPKFWCSCF